jgi:zinc transport system substrate-binding protein
VNPYRLVLLSVLPFCLLLIGCEKRDPVAAESKPEIAVTNTYLQFAVKEFWSANQTILCLAPPGMCQGHFDISPQAVEQLRGCHTLFRFDFQMNMDEQFARFVEQGLAIRSISSPAGLCVPDTYVTICEEISRILDSGDNQNHSDNGDRSDPVAGLRERLDRLSGQLHEKIQKAGLENQPVITSTHQAKFADWLKLDVVATFSGQDQVTPGDIEDCLKIASGHNVKIIIANQQEGTELAKILAERLNGRIVIFSNFPDPADAPFAFDKLLQKNVEHLLTPTK